MSATDFTFENVVKIIWGKAAYQAPIEYAADFMRDLQRLRANGANTPRPIDLELLLRAWNYEVKDWSTAALKRACAKIGQLSAQ